MNAYALAADSLVFVHSLYVLFTLGGTTAILIGAVRHWKWIRNRVFRMIHLGAVLLVALEASIGVLCPLTVWEYRFRTLAGQAQEGEISFVGRIIRSIIFIDLPDWGFIVLYSLFAVIVVILVFFIRPNPPRHKPKKGGSTSV
jgi:hypothetical protein